MYRRLLLGRNVLIKKELKHQNVSEDYFRAKQRLSFSSDNCRRMYLLGAQFEPPYLREQKVPSPSQQRKMTNTRMRDVKFCREKNTRVTIIKYMEKIALAAVNVCTAFSKVDTATKEKSKGVRTTFISRKVLFWYISVIVKSG